MSQLFNHSLAVVAALALTLGSIGTIVTVPSAHALPSADLVELA